jgi:hypothetical protein
VNSSLDSNDDTPYFEFYSKNYNSEKINTYEFILNLAKHFNHEGIEFEDLPIRYFIKGDEFLIIHVWFDGSLNEALDHHFDTFKKGEEMLYFPLNCLPVYYLKHPVIKNVRKLYYEYFRLKVDAKTKECHFVIFEWYHQISEPFRRDLEKICNSMNKVLLKHKLLFEPFKNNDDYFQHRIHSKVKSIPELTNYFMVTLFIDQINDIADVNQDDVSLFWNRSNKLIFDDNKIARSGQKHKIENIQIQNANLFLCRDKVTQESFKLLIQKLAEQMNSEVSLNWKQLNFINNKDMCKFLEKVRIHAPFKIEGFSNKFSFKKRSASEYTVDPLKIQNKNFRVYKVSVELFLWNSQLPKDNDIFANLIEDYEKYRKAYLLKIGQSFSLPRVVSISSFDQLQLFQALSVITNSDQFLNEIRTPVPEISKHLNVLFSRNVKEYIRKNKSIKQEHSIFSNSKDCVFHIEVERPETTYAYKTINSYKYLHKLISLLPSISRHLLQLYGISQKKKFYLEEIIAETIFFNQNKAFMDGYEQDPDSVEITERESEGKFNFYKYNKYLPLLKKNLARAKKMISVKNDALEEPLGFHQVSFWINFRNLRGRRSLI